MNHKEQKKWYRVNRQIRFSPVMVILNDQNLGVMPTDKAMDLAYREGLDLVEVAPAARPPVCKIIDYGKFKYEQGLKDKKAKAQAKSQQLKEVRMRPSIAEHDLGVKINAVRDFLESGNKVQVRIEFKKRENLHKDLGFTLINKVVDALNEISKVTQPPRLDGKYLGCILEPKT